MYGHGWAYGGASGHWDKELAQRYDDQRGYAQANMADNENVPYEPTYRAKPIPKTLILRWEDRLAPSSATDQKTRFSFQLPREINGYDTMTLISANYNPAWFQNMGAVLCIGLDPIKTSAAITSADSTGARAFIPVFSVPNVGVEFGQTNFQRTPNYINYYTTENSSVSVRDLDLSRMTVYLGDESLQTFTLQAVPPVSPYWCTLVLKLE